MEKMAAFSEETITHIKNFLEESQYKEDKKISHSLNFQYKHQLEAYCPNTVDNRTTADRN